MEIGGNYHILSKNIVICLIYISHMKSLVLVLALIYKRNSVFCVRRSFLDKYNCPPCYPFYLIVFSAYCSNENIGSRFLTCNSVFMVQKPMWFIISLGEGVGLLAHIHLRDNQTHCAPPNRLGHLIAPVSNPPPLSEYPGRAQLGRWWRRQIREVMYEDRERQGEWVYSWRLLTS